MSKVIMSGKYANMIARAVDLEARDPNLCPRSVIC